MKKIILTSAVAVVAATGVANADVTDRRQYNQAKRIEQGVRSGQLTRHEAANLRNEQARIRQMEAFAKRDGYVSPRERARLNAAQNAASRHIYVEKHDRSYRGWRWWRRHEAHGYGPRYGWRWWR